MLCHEELLVQERVQAWLCPDSLHSQGMSPAMASQLCAKAGHSPYAKLTSITDEAWQHLHATWRDWVHILQSGNFSPTAAPPPDCSVSVIGIHHDGTLGSALQLADDYYRMPEVSRAAQTTERPPGSAFGSFMRF